MSAFLGAFNVGVGIDEASCAGSWSRPQFCYVTSSPQLVGHWSDTDIFLPKVALYWVYHFQYPLRDLLHGCFMTPKKGIDRQGIPYVEENEI